MESYRDIRVNNNRQTHWFDVLEPRADPVSLLLTLNSMTIGPGAGGGLECWLPCSTEAGQHQAALKAVREGIVGKCWVIIAFHKDSLAPPKHSHLIFVRESFAAPE